LAEADEERIELRLMSDPAFTEEFDIVVDEIAALYAGDRLKGEEKERVEQYFLKSPDRQTKLKFMGELLRQIGTPAPENATNNPVIIAPELGMVARLRTWWNAQPISVRAAAAFATIVIVAGLLLLPGRGVPEPTFASLELALTSAERSTGAEVPKVKLSSGIDELRLTLKLPDDAPPANTYRAQLRGERISRQLSVQQQDAKTLGVVVAANELTRGSYAIELTAVAANGTEVPLRGAYLFAVE
jgi:hypothetical protein